MKTLVLLVLFAFSQVLLAYKDYTGYQLLSVVPNSNGQLHALQRFEKEIVPQNRDEIIIQEYASKIGRKFKVLVSPNTKTSVVDYLNKHGMNFEILMENYGRFLEENKQISEARKAVFAAQIESQFGRSANVNDHFDQYNYHNVAEIEAYMSQVAARHSNFVTISSFGSTQEGRNMTYLKIGYPSNKTKYAFFVHATIHAREWITTPMTLLFINNLTSQPEHELLLRNIDIYVMPVYNPDGYEYTHTTDREWRKNRSGPRKSCYGVDLNRNFAFHWGEAHSSSDPCEYQEYHGPEPASELETKHISKFLKSNSNIIKVYLSLHSCSGLVIHSYNYAEHTYPEDVEDIKKLGRKVVQTMVDAGGPKYDLGSAPDLLYPASGSSDDYAKSVGVKYDYTFELTQCEYGFDSPPSEIEPTARYVLPALFVLAEAVQEFTEYS